MIDALKKLKEFHRVFAAASRSTPGLAGPETVKLRISLMQEELIETVAAMEQGDLLEIADGLADLCYVTIGTAVAYGIPLDKVFNEVHRSNMSKAIICHHCSGQGRAAYKPSHNACPFCRGAGVIVHYREDGKVLKPEGWTPPNIAAALKG